jgi:VWFA-related protein
MVRTTRLTMIFFLFFLTGFSSVFAQNISNTGSPGQNAFLDISFEQNKAFVDDIQINEIRLLDNKHVKITAIETIKELPLRVAILIDTSASQGPRSNLIFRLYLNMIESMPLRAIDSVSLTAFQEKTYFVQNPTSNKTLLIDGINKLAFGEVTALFDSIALVSKTFTDQSNSRNALIVITDGEDKDSKTKIADAYEAAIANNVRVYVFLTRNNPMRSFFGSPEIPGMHQKFAKKTGGKVFKTYDLKSGQDQIMQMIDELNHLQRIRFSTDDPQAIKSGLEISVSRKGVKAYYPSPLK